MNEITELLRNPKAFKVLVVGDVMLDRYFLGDATRISPEAPVPVVEVKEVEERLGGAGNTALNMLNLGLDVHVVSTVGDDEAGERLLGMLDVYGMKHTIFKLKRRTTLKVRVIARNQHVLRIDFEDRIPIDEQAQEQLLEVIGRLCKDMDAIVVSDYAKGTITRSIFQKIRNCHELVIVDPKVKDWSMYEGANYITPNLRELSEALGMEVPNEDTKVEHAGRLAMDKFNLEHVVITRSEKGITFVGKDAVLHERANTKEVFDVSGAGDTVVAVLTFGILNGLSIETTLKLANLCAGIVISKLGTYAIRREDILEALQV